MIANPKSMKSTLLIHIAGILLASVFPAAAAAFAPEGSHLFILSGQSNMREPLPSILGRINDSWLASNGVPHGDLVRGIQQKIGGSHPHGGWVDTDDLNCGLNPWNVYQLCDCTKGCTKGHSLYLINELRFQAPENRPKPCKKAN